jgi:Cytochrome P460
MEDAMRRYASSVVALLAAAGILFPAYPVATAADVAAAPTGVTIPKEYRDWPVVAPSQRDDKDEIRVILGNNIAMKAYRSKTLPFPDGAILAKLAWKRMKSSEFDQTFVPGEPQRIEFMVKNAKKYASTGGWGFGRFVKGKPASEQDHATCFPCHQVNVKDHDFVFTRYAP